MFVTLLLGGETEWVHTLPGVKTREIIEHLLTRYGKITPKDLKETKERMGVTINTSQPISFYFTIIYDSIQFANNRKTSLRQYKLYKHHYWQSYIQDSIAMSANSGT